MAYFDGEGNKVTWHRYRETEVDEIRISPLQSSFNFTIFASNLLNNNIAWGKLTNPPHDILTRGALAVKMPNNQISILEGEHLKAYLKIGNWTLAHGKSLFFYDKELGRVKPMGGTSLSEIYTAVGLINEFQTIVVATCSPTNLNNYNWINKV